MKKRTVLIDLRYLGVAHGFGELCGYYGNYIKEHADEINDLDITLLVPKSFVGKFGDHVKYLTIRRIYKILPILLPKFDIWHNTTQQAKYSSTNPTTKKILSIHDLNFIYEKSDSKANKRLKKLQQYINSAQVITFISQFTKQEVKKHLDISTKETLVNYVGIKDIRFENTTVPQFLINKDKKFLFTISRINKKKNFHVLLDTMKRLPQYDLYICGNFDSEYAKEMIQRIKEESITNIIMPGEISFSEKIWMYKNCHAFLFPSLFEGFGMPVIEAMQFGKPVFSSCCTSLPEIGSIYSYFFKDFTPEHMSSFINENIESFYSDTNRIQQQIEYSLSYTLDRHMNKYLELYRNI